MDGAIKLTQDQVVKIFRLGKKEAEKKRPLLVKCDSEKTKWVIVKASRNLMYLNERHESFPITVTFDRTQKERQDRKEFDQRNE